MVNVTNTYFGVALIAFGLYVGWLATPIVRDSLMAQHSIDTIAALRRSEQVPDSQVRDALAALGDIDERATGDRLIDQGILTLVLAQRLSEDAPARIELLLDARDLAEARLERAPNDTHAWARLSYAEYLLNGPSELAISALGRSLDTGPFEYYALWPRLRLGVVLWPFLDQELRDATMAQAVAALRADGGSYRLARFYFKMPDEV